MRTVKCSLRVCGHQLNFKDKSRCIQALYLYPGGRREGRAGVEPLPKRFVLYECVKVRGVHIFLHNVGEGQTIFFKGFAQMCVDALNGSGYLSTSRVARYIESAPYPDCLTVPNVYLKGLIVVEARSRIRFRRGSRTPEKCDRAYSQNNACAPLHGVPHSS